MPRSTLPAPSLLGRFGSLKTSLLVVSEVGPKYLIWIASSTRRLSICGSESIFLPALREAMRGVATCGWVASLVGEAGRGRADAPSDPKSTSQRADHPKCFRERGLRNARVNGHTVNELRAGVTFGLLLW